jgi:hypothetical protein
LTYTLKERQIDRANIGRQVEELQLLCKKQTMEINELKQLVEVERKAKEVAIQVSEEDHRRKFD